MKSLLLVSLLALAPAAFAQNNPLPSTNPGDATAAPSQPPAQRARERFVDADANHDGRLTRAEAQGLPFVARHFDDIDTNRDGYVSRDELRAARERMQAMRQQRNADHRSGGSAPQPDQGADGTN